MHQSKVSILGIVITFLLLISFMATSVPVLAATKEQIEQQRADIQKMANETLERLYTTQPSAKKAIQKAAGYAVFSNFGMKILFAVGGSCKGIAVINKSGQTTFMKMVEVQAGFGMGVKKFRLIWVFENQSDLDSFINSGWEFGGQATAAMQKDGEGESFAGAVSLSPGIRLYQLTDNGLAMELTAKGTKYYKDDNLN